MASSSVPAIEEPRLDDEHLPQLSKETKAVGYELDAYIQNKDYQPRKTGDSTHTRRRSKSSVESLGFPIEWAHGKTSLAKVCQRFEFETDDFEVHPIFQQWLKETAMHETTIDDPETPIRPSSVPT